jgi:phosphoribosylformylglycinamidine synthase
VINKIGDEVPVVKDPGYFKKTFNTVQDLIMDDLILAGHDISSGGLITTLLEMTFSNTEGGMRVDLSKIGEEDPVKLLFSENPGIVIQVKEVEMVKKILGNEEITYHVIGSPSSDRKLTILHGANIYNFNIDELRDTWFRTSYILDKKQTMGDSALKRFNNYKKNKLSYNFKEFTGRFEAYGISPDRRKETGVKTAIIREKGVNGDREMAYAMYLAGMDVKDIHMTDLVSGRETLEDVNMIVFVGGFSNSDVLGSAKGWAGAFRYNEKAKTALENFYKRDDTLSLGICNGCQLMVELDLVYPDHKQFNKMLINGSGKFESAFLNVDIRKNHSVMLESLEGYRLGIWVAHGEGKFSLPEDETKYHIPVKFSKQEYPGNPNGSNYSAAAICSDDGRHLAMMPHLERAFLPWQCAFYPAERKDDQVTPWIEAFVNARRWIERKSLK